MSGRPLNDALHFLASNPAERRAAYEMAEQERESVRREQLAEQSSSLHAAEERIRIWERLHMLKLPLAPQHELVHVISTQTRLTVQEVQQEQQRRALSVAAPQA